VIKVQQTAIVSTTLYEEVRTREEWPQEENISFVCETNQGLQRMLAEANAMPRGVIPAKPLKGKVARFNSG
jgi:hypothetical protein